MPKAIIEVDVPDDRYVDPVLQLLQRSLITGLPGLGLTQTGIGANSPNERKESRCVITTAVRYPPRRE